VVDIKGYWGILRRVWGNFKAAMKYRDHDNYWGCNKSLIDQNMRNENYEMRDDKDVTNEVRARWIQ
jgi:hypothetical protein